MHIRNDVYFYEYVCVSTDCQPEVDMISSGSTTAENGAIRKCGSQRTMLIQFSVRGEPRFARVRKKGQKVLIFTRD